MAVARHAFDEYGRGAAVCTGRPILDACRGFGGDFSQAARSAAEALSRKWKEFVTIL